jgi:hypothetical protein
VLGSSSPAGLRRSRPLRLLAGLRALLRLELPRQRVTRCFGLPQLGGQLAASLLQPNRGLGGTLRLGCQLRSLSRQPGTALLQPVT